jgi:pseudouridine kinase
LNGAARGLPGFVLVVGAAHIDVMADYRSRDALRLDKVGKVRYSIGGTGYNIAVNLGQDAVPVALVCVLKKNSFSSVWIRERLEGANVDTKFVELSAQIPESGFVGIRRDGDLEGAVTASAIESHTFRTDALRSAIKASALVVVDCNLDAVQLGTVVALAQESARPVVVAAVSDSKVLRLRGLAGSPLDLIAMNERELGALGFDVGCADRPDVARGWCDSLHARSILITRAVRGHLVVNADGGVRSFPAPPTTDIVSTSGAGDALLAGLLAHWYRTGVFDPGGAQRHAMVMVDKALRQPAPTTGALAADADFTNLARIAVREVPLWRRLLTQEIGVLAAVIGLPLAAIQVLFAWFALPIGGRAGDADAASAPAAASAPPVARPASSAAGPASVPLR